MTATLTPEVGEISFAQEFKKYEYEEPKVEEVHQTQDEETVPVEEE